MTQCEGSGFNLQNWKQKTNNTNARQRQVSQKRKTSGNLLIEENTHLLSKKGNWKQQGRSQYGAKTSFPYRGNGCREALQGVMAVSRFSPTASCSHRGHLFQMCRIWVCGAWIKGEWSLNQSTDWSGIILARIKSATSSLEWVACIQCKKHKEV